MKNDPGSNYTLGEEVAAASYTDAATNGAGVDHSNAPSVSFFISVSAVGTSLDVKTQYANQSDFADAVDYPANDDAGNDDAITQITAAGTAQLNVPNPRGRYTRVVATSVGAVIYGITSVLGPSRHVAV